MGYQLNVFTGQFDLVSSSSGGGSGTVTSVGFADASTVPIFVITGSPVVTSGTLTQTLSVQAANTVFAGPTSGPASQPAFRSLVAADIPSLAYANQQLSNLSATAVNTDIIPGSNNIRSLGSSSLSWATLFVNTIGLGAHSALIDVANSRLNATSGGGNTSIRWDSRLLDDVNGNTSLDYANRFLVDSAGTTQLKWSTTGIEIDKTLTLDGSTSGSIAQQASAVTTPYTITWPATQGAASTILTNNGSGSLTWTATSSGANTFLSNLTSPTAINQDLIFDEGTAATVKTKDDPANPTQDLTIKSGDTSSTFNSGAVSLLSGTTVDGNSGLIQINTSQASGTGSSGGISINTGAAGSNTGDITVNTGAPTNANFNSGGFISATGAVTGTGQSGIFQFITGGAADTLSGSVVLASGAIAGSGSSGSLTLFTGGISSVGGGGTGTATLQSGDIDAGAGVSGDVVLHIGTSTGTRGHIKFTDGSEGTAGYVWTSLDTVGSGSWMPGPSATPVNKKELFVLSGTDITNQYIDLTHVALTDSIDFVVQGEGSQIEGASYDYSVSYTGGAGGNTRLSFLNGLATGGLSALTTGDVVVIQYQF